MTLRKVGTYRLSEAREFRQGFETASWYQMIRVNPGTYPVLYDGYWLIVRMPGTVTSSFFISRLGGSYGTPQIHHDKGEPGLASIQTQPYAIKSDPAWSVDLA